jgi:dTDP-glucose pyrophosphorylase
MKTPMQEMFDQLKASKKDEYGLAFAIDMLLENEQAMLEKEKEVMESAWQDGMYECDGDGTFEDFYKTFKTKEK